MSNSTHIRWLAASLLAGLLAAMPLGATEADNALAAALREALPGDGTPYAELDWQVTGGGGMVAIQLRHPAERRLLLWGHAILHDRAPDPQAAGYTGSAASRPAKRQVDRWMWILAGRVELRLAAYSPRFESDEALDRLAAAIRWEALDRL